MLTRYLLPSIDNDIPERISMATILIHIESRPTPILSIPIDKKYRKYCESPIY